MGDQLREIFGSIGPDSGTKRIVLVGERGVGKTWMVKKLSDHAVRKKYFHFSIWIFLCRIYDGKDLIESIACQMSLLVHTEEWEVADDNEEATRASEDEENLQNLKQKISETIAGKRFLLVLDDEGSKIEEADIMKLLHEQLPDFKADSILITRAINTSSAIPGELMKDVKPLPLDDLITSLTDRIDVKSPDIKKLAEGFITKFRSSPSATIIIAKAFNHFLKQDFSAGVRLLENALEDTDKEYNPLRLLRNGCDLLPVNVLFDFSCKESHVFHERGVHYNELITYWILEGYLGRIDSVEKAYEVGHDVVMELIECQILKELEAGYVVMSASVLNLYDWSPLGFLGTVTLGLATVFDSNWKGFGGITHKHGLVLTAFKGKKGKNVSTLLLDGNHFGGEVLTSFPESKEVQVIALFDPTMKELPSSIPKMPKLSVLVLRGSDFLEKVNITPDLKSLTVLEISGATSLKTIPAEFFDNMTQHRSLNLSELKIQSLPSSLYNLKELRCLILKGCSCLRKVGSLTDLVKLQVIDFSYANCLEELEDKKLHANAGLQMLNLSKTKIKTLPLLKELKKLTHLLLSDCADLDRLRSIAPLSSLQILDVSGVRKFKEFHDHSLENVEHLKSINLSNTSVGLLPSNVSNPIHFFLRGCSMLTRLERMESLESLEILDLSGSNQLCEIEEGFVENLKFLQELNLSETKVTTLPSFSNLCNLRELLLSHCESLEKLPELNALRKLEVLDASNCTALTVIPENSFECMPRLQLLNLSETKIKCLPPLSMSRNLRKLLLRNCTNLKNFRMDITLSKLEELNLSGVSPLVDSRAGFLEGMSNLQKLDLSDTMIEGLPTMSMLKSLNVFSLRGCKDIQIVRGLETLTNIEVLNLSGTEVSLSSLESFRNLRQYHSSMKKFPNMNVTDVLGHTLTQHQKGTLHWTHLELLELPRVTQSQRDDSTRSVITREDRNQQQWIISNCSIDAQADSETFGISVGSAQFYELLEDDSNLWKTTFMKFRFLVCPVNQQSRKGNKPFHRSELIFRDTCFQAWKFSQPREEARSLEIRGFQNEPVGVDVLLHHAYILYLTDNPFIKLLSDLGVDNIKTIRVCLIERCNNMETVIDAEKVSSSAKSGELVPEILEDNLEIIFISNATNLQRIVRGNLKGNIFKNLKCLYLDCCPKLSEVFSSSQQFDNLEVLEIKFCDELKTLFGDESPKLPKLRTLNLWALSKLEKVGGVAPVLQSLQVGECPMLVTVLSSSPRLETMIIKCCDRLQSVFEHNVPLPALQKLHMWGLPLMESVGVELLPLTDCLVGECPKLKDKFILKKSSSNTSH